MALRLAIAYAKNELCKNPKDPVLQGWLTIIAQREIDNSEVKAQLEELKDFVDTDGKRIIPAPIVDRSIRSTIGATLGKVPIPVQTQSATAQNDVQEVKDALAEINPENLEKAVRTSEKFINILPDGQTKSTLRGIHGAIIFDILRSAGHNLTMQNGQIMIIPKPGTDIVNLQEELQTLVNTNRISLDTIKLGMLYSSPSFSKYAEMKKTKDASGKDIIDPKASTENFIMYLNDLPKAGNKSGDIESILKSQSLLVGVNMPQAIAGFNDMGQIGAWMEKNADKVKAAVNTGAVATGGNAPANAPPAPNTPNIPSAPSNRFTAQLGQDGKT